MAGSAATSSPSSELYDVATGNWARGPAMHVGRDEPAAALLDDGRVLLSGGRAPPSVWASAELFEP